eukprot:NODE_409_length_9212_cov_0.585537.p7 type:complete len:169 gc:universal NODE_409_length_9212_cov_0.585537:4376-3870(-)
MIRNLYQKALFVGKIPYSAAIEDLKVAFPNALDIHMPRNITGEGVNRGFAFVTLDDSTAEKFLNSPPSVLGQSIVVKEKLSPNREVQKSNSIYFGNLPSSINEDALREIAPNALSVKVLSNANGVFGFADFENVQDAEQVMNANSNLTLDGKDIRVQFGREKRQQSRY